MEKQKADFQSASIGTLLPAAVNGDLIADLSPINQTALFRYFNGVIPTHCLKF